MPTVGDRFPTFRLTTVTSRAPRREFEEVTDASHHGKWRVVRQLLMVAVLAVAPRVSAACRPFGTQLECDVGSSRVVIGTQAAAQSTGAPSFSFLSFAGDACFPNDPAPPRGLQIQLQDVGTDPTLCRKIGNETYCY